MPSAMKHLPQLVVSLVGYFIGWHARDRRANTDKDKDDDTISRKDSMLARLHKAICPIRVLSCPTNSRNNSRKSLLTSDKRPRVHSPTVERSFKSDLGPAPERTRDLLYSESVVCLPPTHTIFNVIKMLQDLKEALQDVSPEQSAQVEKILKTLGGGEMDNVEDSTYNYSRNRVLSSGTMKDISGQSCYSQLTDVSTCQLLRSFSTPAAAYTSLRLSSRTDVAGDYNPLVGIQMIDAKMVVKTCSEHRNGSVILKEPGVALQRELDKIEDWKEFDIFLVAEMSGGHPMVVVAMTLFDKYDILNKLNIPRDLMLGFLDAVETAYFQEGNPYHNSLHATDVLQSMAVMLYTWGLATHLTDEEVFACLLGAIIHDVGHPGYTNEFQVNNCYERAVLYNDLSVNENHHVALSFRIAQNPRCNIFVNMNRPQYKSLRQLLVNMVLGTDMSNHFSMLEQFSNQLSKSIDPSEWDAAGRESLLKIILHCADLSNPGKPVPAAVRWSELLVKEFYLQGDEERKNNSPVTPICDRNIYMMPRSQLGFITFIVQPTLSQLGALAPSIVQEMLPLLEETRQYWAKEVEILDMQEAERCGRQILDMQEAERCGRQSRLGPMPEEAETVRTSTDLSEEAP